MKQTIIYLSLFLFALSGCKKDEENIKPKSGYFILTEIKNPNIKSTQTIYDEPIITEFLLGDLKASKEFYFLISNGGENPIFNVNLITDNIQFAIAPENISILAGSNSEVNDNIIPLISLGILHGIQLNGVGYTDLLPMGENSAILTITGKTIENEDTIDLESNFSFKINAKIMDISIYSNGQEINLLNPTGVGTFGNFGSLGIIRYYRVTSNSIEMENIGNVDININGTTIDDIGTETDLGDIALLQNHTVNINLSQHFTVLFLDSDGTITNDSRIQLGNDGKGYLAIEEYIE